MSLASEEDTFHNSSTNHNISGNDDSSVNYEPSDDENTNIEIITSLKTIYINLPFTPSPTHTCETRVSCPPVNSVKEKINKFGVEMRLGPFTPAEDKIIIKNWDLFSRN